MSITEAEELMLVGNEGWQEVPVLHWDWGEFLSRPWRKVPRRVGVDAKVGIIGRSRRGWSRNLGGPLWIGMGALGCASAELEESTVRVEKLG